MTTTDFNLACTNISFFNVKYSGSTPILDCPGRPGCSMCVFGPKSTYSNCYLQDRDNLTLKQLDKLQTDYPELFI